MIDRKRPESDNDEIGGKRIIKAKPVPHHGVPVILPSQSMKTTTVEPFSFSERDMMAKELKAKRIEAVLNEEKKEKQFKANPMPKDIHLTMDGKPVNLTKKKIVETQEYHYTLTLEFMLQSDWIESEGKLTLGKSEIPIILYDLSEEELFERAKFSFNLYNLILSNQISF